MRQLIDCAIRLRNNPQSVTRQVKISRVLPMQLMHSTLTPLRVFEDGLEPAGFAELEAVCSFEDKLDDDRVARRQ
jgi:hypothetical protein